MGVRILYGSNNRPDSRDRAALYCSTSDWAFGPIFYEQDGHDADERAESFLRFLKVDPRRLSDSELVRKYSEWLSQESEQWKQEEKKENEDEV